MLALLSFRPGAGTCTLHSDRGQSHAMLDGDECYGTERKIEVLGRTVGQTLLEKLGTEHSLEMAGSGGVL